MNKINFITKLQGMYNSIGKSNKHLYLPNTHHSRKDKVLFPAQVPHLLETVT